MLLVESGIPKDTLLTLSNVRKNTQEAIKMIQQQHQDFQLETCDIAQARKLLADLTQPFQDCFMAAVENHEITKKALSIFQSTQWDYQNIGKLMYEHHSILCHRLGVSHPLIDHFIHTAMDAGGYGGKIVGSGSGGCAVILCPTNKTNELIELLLKAGAKAAYEISVSQGSYAVQ